MSRNRGKQGDSGQENQGKGMGRTQYSGELAQDAVEKVQRQVDTADEDNNNVSEADSESNTRAEE